MESCNKLYQPAELFIIFYSLNEVYKTCASSVSSFCLSSLLLLVCCCHRPCVLHGTITITGTLRFCVSLSVATFMNGKPGCRVRIHENITPILQQTETMRRIIGGQEVSICAKLSDHTVVSLWENRSWQAAAGVFQLYAEPDAQYQPRTGILNNT